MTVLAGSMEGVRRAPVVLVSKCPMKDWVWAAELL